MGGTEPQEAAADKPAINTLTEAERAAGWRLLFDGESLDGWRGYRMEGVPAGWSVTDGTIHFVPPTEGKRGDLITVESWADFELSLEWAVTPGGNSGIFFRVSEDGEATYHTGPEVQVLDNAGHADGKSPLTSAGSNYALHAPPSDATRPLGEFNEVFLRVEGDRVSHSLNGEATVEYTLWDADWEARVAASKFAQWPGYGRNTTGHVALQDHGNEVWFRNLKIRVLGNAD
ncbi:MAG: DUF1080 domain-containing protein [Thermoanaerobaculia bacterium]|nr:DUF1080 domain-containing protein [Thermoanaerobaculia bacterium]